MQIDIHSLAFVSGLTNLLQAIILFIQYRVDKAHQGPGWWALGSASLALAFGFNFLRDHPALGMFAIIANNAFFVSGLALFYVGVQRFFDQMERRGWVVAVCVSVTVVALYFTYFDNNLAARRVNLSVAMAGLSFLIAWSIYSQKARSAAVLANFLALLFLVYGGMWAFRGLSAMVGPTGEIFNASLMQGASYLASMMTSTLWTLGLILLVSQQLNTEYREAKESAELIFNTSPDAVLITRLEDGQFVDVNDGFTALSGYTRTEVCGKTTLEVEIWKNPSDRQEFVAELLEKGFCENREAIFQRKDGTQFFGIVSSRWLVFKGQPHIITVTRDITERKRVQEALRDNNLFLSGVIENNGALIYVKDLEGNYELVNKKWEETTGLARQNVLGKTDVSVFPGEIGLIFRRTDLEVMNGGRVVEQEECLLTPTGERHFLSIKFPLQNTDGSVRGLCGMASEITERKKDEKRIQELVTQLEIERDFAQHSALTDGLTRLANRRHFDDLLHTEFFRLKRSGAPLSLILLDVDHFKNFNDNYGHLAGDECLRRVGRAMATVVGRGSDLAARYGGEEFAVILPETDHLGARTMAERIRRAIEELDIPHAGNSAANRVTVSLGVVTQKASDLVSVDKMIEMADDAMYRAK